jgi:SNF2 family DNA or RNA helicase
MAHISIQNGVICVDDCYDQRKIVSDLGGKWDGLARTWTLTFTIFNLESLMNSLDPVTVASGMEAHVEAQRAKESQLAKIKELSKQNVPTRLKVSGFKCEPYNYQRYGIAFAVMNGYGVLNADSMGLGKSSQAIATAVTMKAQGRAKSALVVTPASLKYNWPLEIEKFTDETYVVIDGDSDTRIAQWLRQDVFFYIVNYELVVEDLFGGREFRLKAEDSNETIARKKKSTAKAERRARILAPVRNRIWDVVIADEVHLIKTHAARRSRVMKQLRAKFRLGLTGTPLDGRLEELHSVMDWIAPGILGSKTHFFQRHVTTDFYGKVKGYKRIKEVSERIQPFFIRRLKEDVLPDLPAKIFQNRVIQMSPEELRIYKAIAKGAHEVTEDAEAIVALIRCKQFCDYPPMVDDSCKHTSKLDAMREVVEEVVLMNGNKAILFTQYKTVLDIVAPALAAMGVKFMRLDGDTPKKERADMQAMFLNDKSIDMMVGTDAMSTGLNLQAANHVINYDDFWSPSIMDQRADRCCRIGQKDAVVVVNFICKDTIEERIRSVIYNKSRISAQVLGDETDEMVLKRLNPRELVQLL